MTANLYDKSMPNSARSLRVDIASFRSDIQCPACGPSKSRSGARQPYPAAPGVPGKDAMKEEGALFLFAFTQVQEDTTLEQKKGHGPLKTTHWALSKGPLPPSV